MRPRLFRSLAGRALPMASLVLVALVASPANSASGNIFSQLNGYWSGGGSVSPLKGKGGSVSCRATYSVSGSNVTQNLRCSGSGDVKFSTSANFTYKGSAIRGSWTESTYSAAGGMSGTASGSSIRARISGDKFSGRMTVSVSGSRQTINIVQLDKRTGAYKSVANLSLHR